MNEISIKLQGGLGNYMFQIACVYSYSMKYNKKSFFTINDSVSVHKNIEIYKSNIFNKINLVNDKKIAEKLTIYNEPHFHYTQIPEISGNVYLNGYFQSEKYFEGFNDEIKQLFLPDLLTVEQLKKLALNKYNVDLTLTNTCSIHIRRGDYLMYPHHHPVQTMNYYMKAIKLLPKDSVFLIFSDDIMWCKENFPNIPEKFIFIDNQSDYEDLMLMTLCKNNIICNSTFSWWSAWLNLHEDKIVIAPSKWFGSAYANNNTKDLYCAKWILI